MENMECTVFKVEDDVMDYIYRMLGTKGDARVFDPVLTSACTVQYSTHERLCSSFAQKTA